MLKDQILIREVEYADLDRCYEIESAGYAGDEAATREKIGKRIEVYPQGFLVLEAEGVIAGLINSGATNTVQLSDESFKELIGHDPDGKKIVIMSVVVHPDFQNRGLAGMLLTEFIGKMKAMAKTEIHLICQTELIDMYARHGFEYLGKSDSDHGGLHWHEMIITL
jgi:ribosomal protein S18 acetylase RimI-like enzyme